MHTERDSEDEESEPAEPAAAGVRTGPALDQAQSWRPASPYHNHATPFQTLNNTLLADGATWIADTTSGPLACLGVRFLHVNDEEAFGLVKLASTTGAGTMQYHHEFFSAELSQEQPPLGDSAEGGSVALLPFSATELLTGLKFETENARFALRVQPHPPREQRQTKNASPVQTPPRLAFSPPPSPKLPLSKLEPVPRRTYAAVLKGAKPIEEIAVSSHEQADARQVWSPTPLPLAMQGPLGNNNEEHSQDGEAMFPPPSPSPEFFDVFTPHIQPKHHSSGSDEYGRPPLMSRGRSRRRVPSGPLFGTDPFSTSLTNVKLSGTLTALGGSKSSVNLSFIGTTSVEEFISTTIAYDSSISRSSLKNAFKPAKRKDKGYVESSCAFTIV